MNEGDNFGTANGGNGQPNDNSFDSGQPASAIMSDSGSGAKQGNIPVISTSGATNTSKFFGGRSHRGSRAKTGNQQNDFLAAQKIASDPNTPQFFSEAVVANSFTPISSPRRSRLPLIIAIIATVATVAIILALFLLKNVAKNNTDEFSKLPEDVQAMLTDEDVYLNIVEFEHSFEQISNASFDTWGVLDRSVVSMAQNRFEKYKEFATFINGYDKSKLSDSQKKLFDSINNTTETMIPKYEAILGDYHLIVEAYVGKDAKSRRTLSASTNKKLNELTNYLNEKIDKIDNLHLQYSSMGCKSGDELSKECEKIRNSYLDIEELLDFPKYFSGYVNSYNDGAKFGDENYIYDNISPIKESRFTRSNENE